MQGASLNPKGDQIRLLVAQSNPYLVHFLLKTADIDNLQYLLHSDPELLRCLLSEIACAARNAIAASGYLQRDSNNLRQMWDPRIEPTPLPANADISKLSDFFRVPYAVSVYALQFQYQQFLNFRQELLSTEEGNRIVNDPVKFWKSFQPRGIELTALAQKYLSYTFSSIAAECASSILHSINSTLHPNLRRESTRSQLLLKFNKWMVDQLSNEFFTELEHAQLDVRVKRRRYNPADSPATLLSGNSSSQSFLF